MASLLARPRKTVDDLWALPEDTYGELIDGEIYVNASPEEPHQSAVGDLLVALHDHVRKCSGGRVYVGPFAVHLESADVVIPDLRWIRRERLSIVKNWVFGAPDLLVEILSPSNPERDQIVKRALYARNGVLEYWIVHPKDRAIEVLRLDGTAYLSAGYFTTGQRLVSPLLPGLSIGVDAVFRL